MKVVVRVTADDLANGRFSSIIDCPIARGLKRTFPGQHITVGGFGFYLNGYWTGFKAISPRLKEASSSIQKRSARPFWFRVTVPNQESEP